MARERGRGGTPSRVAFAARQSTSKLSVWDKIGVMGCSGSIGLAQRYEAVVKKTISDINPATLEGSVAGQAIREKLAPLFQMEVQIAAVAGNLVGHASRSPAICTFLLATKTRDGLTLVEFDLQGAPTVATADLMFFAIGSGQPIADPFLAFLRRVVWNDKASDRKLGVRSVLWTLQHAVHTNPGGIADPIEIVVKGSGHGGCTS
jgi:20S proteasome alpha/beta subunit